MGIADSRRSLLHLRHKRAESTISLANTHPSTISDQDSTRESPSWFRIPKKGINLTSVNEEIEELLKTQNHITIQLNEAQRLRRLKEPVLDPNEINWVDGTISDIEEATREVAIFLEPTRVEKATCNGKLSLGTQIRWAYRDGQRARDKKHRLIACHSSLMAVLAHLQRVNLPEAITIHELGAEVSSQSAIVSSLSLQSSADGLYQSMKSMQDTVSPVSLNQEMSDLLAWRRSKGTHAS